jgi:hypothetical protein
MAACHPKLKTDSRAVLFLSRFADGEWQGVVRPWLEAGRGTLERSIVVAPTRGHTQALKQRCMEEGVALLGVEFLTPALARKKRGVPAGLGKSLQLLVLRNRIASRVEPLAPDDKARGVWRSLESDLESALADFDELIRSGFRPGHFPRPELRSVFGEMAAWVEAHGYKLGPVQDEIAAEACPAPGSPPVADRVLILAGGAEGRGDFFGLVALARRCASVCVVIAEPEFLGRKTADEQWVGDWEKALEAQAVPIDASYDPAQTCAPVADLWTGTEGSADLADILVGYSRSDEVGRVVAAVSRLLASGSRNIAVVFPGAGSAHARLLGLLEKKGIPYADLIGTSGTPPIDIRIQRALVDFYERGCRIEELLSLWPLLRSLNLTTLTPAEARTACQRFFDEFQSHAIEPNVEHLTSSDRDGWQEVGRVAKLLLPAWPERLTALDALDRFEAARDRLTAAEPAGWPALREFAKRAPEPMPASNLLGAIRTFLPEKAPASVAPGKSTFARVTLTTCRRAAGIAWSDVIFTESNAGTWPEPRELGIWLGDAERRTLGEVPRRLSLGLPTSDDQAALERSLYRAIARDTRGRVTFSAALFDEEEPEVRLGPNAWLERVMWSKGLLPEKEGQTDAFERIAKASRAEEAGPAPAAQAGWAGIWLRRRDPSAPFDEYFLGDPQAAHGQPRFSAKQIERGVVDPAVLWFEAVLRVRRVEWSGFARAREKAAGDIVHRVLASALRGAPVEGQFSAFPSRPDAQAALEGELVRLRTRWPADRYWDSFHMDVSRAAFELLHAVYELPAAPFCSVEAKIPEGSTIPVGKGRRAPVTGRMDLVLSSRPSWPGARVEIVDFKTGGDSGVSVKKMASSGASLQLGVYLAAASSAGATGNVWMLKPDERPTKIATEDLDAACVKFRIIGDHLESGLYGARTPDRTEYTHGFEWPLACAPIAAAILESKFAATFGAGAEANAESVEDLDE